MSETRCKYAGSDQPRILVGRHNEDCPDEDCHGCLPCPMDHCRVCTVEHATGACPNCLAEVRDNLDDIRRMSQALPAEVETRGVDGEAMNLLGPAADPEARGHWEASVLAGRIVPVDCDARDLDDVKAWLETAAHELHPLIVIGGWAIVYRDAFEHTEPVGRVDALTEAGYLGRNLTEMAAVVDVPFEDFARDLRRCVAHMERVLHDGEQVDRGAPCMTCGKPLERTWGTDEDHDGWKCPRCRTESTEAQYRFAVAHLHREEATHLTDRDMEIRTGVKAGTIRVWALRGIVGRRTEGGRVVYSVAQVEAEARQRGLLAS
jgi:hypothetical protein